MIGYGIASAIIVAGLAWIVFRPKGKAGSSRAKVVTLSSYKSRRGKMESASPKKTGSQLCSTCRKPSSKLSFYADEDGRIVGLCRECKPSAERRKLDRL